MNNKKVGWKCKCKTNLHLPSQYICQLNST